MTTHSYRSLRSGVGQALGLVVLAGSLVHCGNTEDSSPRAPGIDPSFLDRSVSPCDDFYQFACGTWIAEHPTDESPSVDRIREGEARNAWLLKRILEDDADGQPYVPHPDSRKLGDYYAACIEERAADRAGDGQLDGLFQAVDALTTVADLGPALATLHASGVGALFYWDAEADPGDPTRRVATLNAGSIGMPDRSYYLDPADSILTEYQDHIRRLSALYPKALAIDPAAVVDVESALAQAMLSPDDAMDPTLTYHLGTVEALAAALPDFPLTSYLAAAGWPSSLSEVNVTDPGYASGVQSVLATKSVEVLKSYLKWSVLEDYADTLGQSFVTEEARFHNGVFYGDPTPSSDWWSCQQSAVWALGFELSQPFVDVRFDEQQRVAAEDLLSGIKAAFRANLASRDWLDAATRAAAEAKLDNVLDLVGYPDSWPQSSSVTIDRTSHVGNVLRIVRDARAANVAALSRPVNRAAWTIAPCVTNAFYAPGRNQMVFPAGILQTPVFGVDRLRAVNYGAMGAVMGHELSHGFDDLGSQYDGNGTLRDWWSPEVATEFSRRTSCLVDQYSNYQAAPGTPVDGEFTLGENMADLAGLKIAQLAYQASGVEASSTAFSAEQEFFLAYAQLWCANTRPELLASLAVTDPHSPARFRVNGVVANLPAFAQAFQCAAGSPMAPAHRCEVW